MPTASGDALIYDLAEQKRTSTAMDFTPAIRFGAGANIGVFTRKALWAGASKVIAIEPGPENLECLRRNFPAEIADGRVVLYPKGFGTKTMFSSCRSTQPIRRAIRSLRQSKCAIHRSTVDHRRQNGCRARDCPKWTSSRWTSKAPNKGDHGRQDTIAKFRPRMALCIYHVKGDEIMVRNWCTTLFRITKSPKPVCAPRIESSLKWRSSLSPRADCAPALRPTAPCVSSRTPRTGGGILRNLHGPSGRR